MISTNNHHDDDDDVCLFVFVIENNISLSSLNFLFLFFSQIFVNLISLIIKVVRVVEMNFMALIMTHQKQKKNPWINQWMNDNDEIFYWIVMKYTNILLLSSSNGKTKTRRTTCSMNFDMTWSFFWIFFFLNSNISIRSIQNQWLEI